MEHAHFGLERLLQGLNDIDWAKVLKKVKETGLGNQLVRLFNLTFKF
jgi:hypothetical protein